MRNLVSKRLVHPGCLFRRPLLFAGDQALQTGAHQLGMSSRVGKENKTSLVRLHTLHHEHPTATLLHASPVPRFLGHEKTLF